MAITKDVMMGKTLRKSFAKQEQILELPNMLKIQKDSYEWFLREGPVSYTHLDVYKRQG